MIRHRTNPQYLALLACVLASPEDDLLREMLADWIEEHATTTPCMACNAGLPHQHPGKLYDAYNRKLVGCYGCGGDGVISNGEVELAEFIRVQIELARMSQSDNSRDLVDERCSRSPNLEAGCRCRGCVLRRRERELLKRHHQEFFLAPREFSPTTMTVSGPQDGSLCWISSSKPGVLVNFAVCRGFVAEVRCRLADWCGGECENCGGTGRVDGDRYEQSEPCPDCGGEYGPSEEGNPRGVYPGTGRTVGIGPWLVREHPIEVVVLTDREPSVWTGRTGAVSYFWYDDRRHGGISHGPAYLPAAVYDLIDWTFDISDPDDCVSSLDSRSVATAALSAALIAWAVKESRNNHGGLK